MGDKRIVFHYPIFLDPQAKTASGIRPRKMLQAFKDIGYEVDEVSGFGKEREKKIHVVIAKIRQGVRYDYVYSESSIMPTALTDNHHLPLRPFMDYRLFRLCYMAKIPIGLFYRDIYWLFPDYNISLPFWKAILAKFFFRTDLLIYEKYITKLYLPSLQMKSYVPYISEEKFGELPPAHDVENSLTPQLPSGKIRLFYVGGMGQHYQMHHLWKAVSELDFIHLTICTRQAEWQNVKKEYESLCDKIPDNIEVIHESGTELKARFLQSDIFLIFVYPKPYWSFAVPVKLYEYIGEGKPIIATYGTKAGEIVTQFDLGWTIPYQPETIKSLLYDLKNTKENIREKAQNVKAFGQKQTWKERAKQVGKDLIIENSNYNHA